jgi:predicted transglutaminase-like cysteine proteinase
MVLVTENVRRFAQSLRVCVPASLTILCFPFCLALAAVSTICIAAEDFQSFRQTAQRRYGEAAAQTVDDWQLLIERSRQLPDTEKLIAINTFFNRSVSYEEDARVWRVHDYWATPLETLGRRAGDCEDFTIGKYVSLGLLGVPIDRLRLTYVRAELGRAGSGISQAHMVLAYYATPGAEPLILDNLINDVRPASRRLDLAPVFGFNSEGLWVAGNHASLSADPTARLSHWRDVLRRMREEGF